MMSALLAGLALPGGVRDMPFMRAGPRSPQHCATVGRDPSEIEISAGVGGKPSEKGQQLLDLGVTLFTVGTGSPDYDFSELREWVAWRDQVNG